MTELFQPADRFVIEALQDELAAVQQNRLYLLALIRELQEQGRALREQVEEQAAELSRLKTSGEEA